MSKAELLLSLLKEKNMTVAFAESCTGGKIAAALTDLSGASDVFGYGLVTYSNEAKERLLGVHSSILQDYGAVSSQTAGAMAVGLKNVSRADLTVAVTGIAGPNGGTAEKPVGLVFISVAGYGKVIVEKCLFAGTRAEIRNQVVESALDSVCTYLQNFSVTDDTVQQSTQSHQCSCGCQDHHHHDDHNK